MNDRLVKANKELTPEGVWPAWNEKKRDVDAAVTTAIQQAEQLLIQYAPGGKPQELDSASETLSEIPNRISELQRARDLVTSTIEWILANGDMKQNKREANAKQLRKMLRRLDDKESDLKELECKYRRFSIIKHSLFLAKLTEDVDKQQRAEQISSNITVATEEVQQLSNDPNADLARIKDLESQIQQLLDDLNSLSTQEQMQYSPLIQPSNVNLHELKRQLDLLLPALEIERQKRDTHEVQSTELPTSEAPEIVQPPTTEELKVKTHEVPTTPTVTISVVDEESLSGEPIPVHQEESIPALVSETTTIIEQASEPQLQETTQHAEVYAPSDVVTTVSTVKNEELAGEPFLVKEEPKSSESSDKRTPKEKVQDLLENTENLLKNEDLPPSELVSKILVTVKTITIFRLSFWNVSTIWPRLKCKLFAIRSIGCPKTNAANVKLKTWRRRLRSWKQTSSVFVTTWKSKSSILNQNQQLLTSLTSLLPQNRQVRR
jgi:hypothetical protein